MLKPSSVPLQKSTYEIVVVDNASADDSLAQLRANEVAARMIASEQLRIFNNSENRGFGAANNQAFALTDSPFVFLLNLDTEVPSGNHRHVDRQTRSRIRRSAPVDQEF